MNKTKECNECGKSFIYEAMEWEGREIIPPQRCNDCTYAAREKDREIQRKKNACEEWHRICPPLYRDTDISRLPKAYREAIETWERGPKGLGFLGKHGRGKTRTAFQILKKQLELGASCEAITATGFAELCANQYRGSDESRETERNRMISLQDAAVLLFDDLGKGKMTERVETEFYGLLERRTGNLLPTIWTANSEGDALARSMSDERRDAILRRLSEFSEAV